LPVKYYQKYQVIALNEHTADFIYRKLLEKIDTDKVKDLEENEKSAIVKEMVLEIIDCEKMIIGPKDAQALIENIYLDSFAFGPITDLLKNDDISEILINDFNEIYIEECGLIKKTRVCFRDCGHIKNIIDKILSPLGLRIDESCPMVDARLKDGSRINVVIKPVSFKNIVVSIRKFKKRYTDMDKLIESEMLDPNMAKFLSDCVLSKLNIIVTGATSTGKTTFLNVLSDIIPKNERVISIEDTLELNLHVKHCVRLEARPSNIEGKGEISIRDLVRNALRMRPDRIVVGEMRGTEAVDVLSAMNTGHAGSMTTVHANSPKDMISRIETMLLMSGIHLNPVSSQRIIASSIDLIVHLERLNEGKRIVSAISCLNGFLDAKNLQVSIDDIYSYDASQENPFLFSGHIPDFAKKFRQKSFGLH
jgi:pilus assembly protein CpaF